MNELQSSTPQAASSRSRNESVNMATPKIIKPGKVDTRLPGSKLVPAPKIDWRPPPAKK